MLPTLRAERAATYSPILPVSAKSGIVLQVPVTVVDAEAGLVSFEDEGETITHSVLGGGAKLQWKVDWAMRWVALGVDYEMYGKDLRSEEHTSELQSLMRISYAVFCLKTKKKHDEHRRDQSNT